MMEPTAGTRARSVLAVRKLSMTFGPTRALVEVDLDIHQGEVLGIIGTNGAGKSTLIKVISGVHQPSAGEVELDGHHVVFQSPLDAARAGIQTVHQQIDEGIVRGMSAAENLVLDGYADGSASWFVNPRSTRARAARVAQAMGLDIDLGAPVEALSPSDRQQLIIARALSRSPRVLILDEPTSTLSAIEATRLYEAVRLLAGHGVAVIFISHELAEIETLCDRVVVLRDGRVQGDFATPVERTTLVAAMLGELSALKREHSNRPATSYDGEVVLEVDGVSARPGGPPISFAVRRGEIVGLTGLIAAGKTELLEQVFGARPLIAGRLLLQGRTYTPHSPADAVAAGVAFVPEDRATLALVPGWSVTHNLTLPFLRAYCRLGLMRPAAEHRMTNRFITSMAIRCAGPDAAIDSLSGGNQQKLVVARWLQSRSVLLILDEPFRGIDIGARRVIIEQLRQQRDRAVIVASSDPEEILEVADRILVLAGGSLVGELSTADATATRLVHLMAGARAA
jgi:simple sugar transport system ATP-binding protein